MTGPGRRDGVEGLHNEQTGRYGTVCQQCGHIQFRRKPRAS